MYEKNGNLKICFLSLNSYPILIGKDIAYTGGAEVQQVELAKELQRKGYKIYFITYAANSNEVKIVNGINIIPVYNRRESNKLSYSRKIFLIWKKLKDVNADIYYYRAGSPGILSIFCKLNKKKFIKSIATDAEVIGKSLGKKNRVIDFLLKFANWLDIKLSNIVISQNDFQKSELKRIFKVESIIIKNAFYIPPHVITNRNADSLLWVGNIRSVKQPSLFLEVAKHFPDYKFMMIGGIGENEELFRNIKNSVEKIPNLDFIGFVSHDKIFNYYKKAILLINTSKTEGFPNIFLEAWLCSIPVISLNVNPDGIISKYRLGYHSKTFNQMLDDIKRLLNDKELLETLGENGRKYVEENHDIIKIADQYEDLIENLEKNR